MDFPYNFCNFSLAITLETLTRERKRAKKFDLAFFLLFLILQVLAQTKPGEPRSRLAGAKPWKTVVTVLWLSSSGGALGYDSRRSGKHCKILGIFRRGGIHPYDSISRPSTKGERWEEKKEEAKERTDGVFFLVLRSSTSWGVLSLVGFPLFSGGIFGYVLYPGWGKGVGGEGCDGVREWAIELAFLLLCHSPPQLSSSFFLVDRSGGARGKAEAPLRVWLRRSFPPPSSLFPDAPRNSRRETPPTPLFSFPSPVRQSWFSV